METALFSPSSLFRDGDDDDDNNDGDVGIVGEEQSQELFMERTHSFPGMDLLIREFSFHHLNANLLWPGTFSFAEWLLHNRTLLHGLRILELGSGTGALAIFLRKSFGVDITTSDFDDKEVEENIAYNCIANKLDVLPHIRHSWGDVFPAKEPNWDLIIASDILLYVKQYPNLIRTLCFLLNSYKPEQTEALDGNDQIERNIIIPGKQRQFKQPLFLMSWRRRIGKDEELFFSGCENAGLTVEHMESRVYCISPRRDG